MNNKLIRHERLKKTPEFTMSGHVKFRKRLCPFDLRVLLAVIDGPGRILFTSSL